MKPRGVIRPVTIWPFGRRFAHRVSRVIAFPVSRIVRLWQAVAVSFVIGKSLERIFRCVNMNLRKRSGPVKIIRTGPVGPSDLPSEFVRGWQDFDTWRGWDFFRPAHRTLDLAGLPLAVGCLPGDPFLCVTVSQGVLFGQMPLCDLVVDLHCFSCLLAHEGG